MPGRIGGGMGSGGGAGSLPADLLSPRAGPTMVYEEIIELTIGVSPRILIPTRGYDACSISSSMVVGADFDSGIIKLKKTQDPNATSADLNATPVTITAPGNKELDVTDWGRAAFLEFTVSTSSTGRRVVQLVITMAKLGLDV